MTTPPITEYLEGLARGEKEHEDRLAEAVLSKLQMIAARQIARRSSGGGALTIEAGVLADDALLKALRAGVDFSDSGHFFAYATRVMVNALIDEQRRRNASRRGGDLVRVSLTYAEDLGVEASPVDVEHLPPILEELAALDERKSQIVQMRVFWGLTIAEVAAALGISTATVERDWRFAQRWLAARLRRKASED